MLSSPSLRPSTDGSARRSPHLTRRVKGKHNYVGRIIASIATCGIYQYWWTYDLEVEGNRHLEQNWPWEDALVAAVDQLAATTAP